MESYIEDDWENIVVPDLLSEREKKILEERKKVEESDAKLCDNLFSTANKGSPLLFSEVAALPLEAEVAINGTIKTTTTKTKPIYKKQEQQQQKREIITQKKIQNKRITEIFGEANIDCHYELYGHIEDQYFSNK